MSVLGVPHKWDEEERKKLGEELIDFVKKDHVFHIVQFTRLKNKTYGWWMDLCNKYDDLLQYHKLAKEIIGGKIVQKAFENGNQWAIQTFLPKYLDDVQTYLDTQEDKKVDRQMRLEKYRNEIGQASHESAKAKADDMNISIELMGEIQRLRSIIKNNNIESDIE